MNVCRASASAGSTQQSLQWYVKMCSVFLPGTWVCLLLMLSHLSPSHRMHCAYLWIYAYFITTPQMAGHKCIAVEVAEVLLRRFLRFKMTNFYAHNNWVVLDFQGGGASEMEWPLFGYLWRCRTFILADAVSRRPQNGFTKCIGIDSKV